MTGSLFGASPTASLVSKKLRSKDVTTTEIYDISVQLLEGKIAVHFPKKEVFVLELIVDRWNNQKNTQFKRDPHMWRLFNQMWGAVESDTLRKKIFRVLRYVPHLVQTLELENLDHTLELAEVLATNFELLNSSFIVEMSQDQAMAIIAGILRIILSSPELKREMREKLLTETLRLTRVSSDAVTNNISNNKLGQRFCSNLLPFVLQYSAQYDDEFVSSLCGLIDRYIFAPEVDSVKLLSQFLGSGQKCDLSDQCYTILYRKCIKAVSKKSMLELEEIFTLITKARPSLTSVLLQELSALKKTLSQKFLEALFEENYQKFSSTQALTADTYWAIAKKILKLDIEVGIINTTRIMNELAKTPATSNTLAIWETLIDCYVNARELPRFLDLLKDYSQSPDKSTVFVDDAKYHQKVTKEIPSMSSTQIKAYFDTIADELSRSEVDTELSLKLLNVAVRGLYSLPYSSLPELEGSLTRLLETGKHQCPAFWTFTYHFLNIYADIFTNDRLTQIQSMIFSYLEVTESTEVFLTAFMLRELKEFELEEILDKFRKHFRQSDGPQKRELLRELFCNWSTLLNLCFSEELLAELIDQLLLAQNLDLLDSIALSDDFFEESRIMSILTDKLCDDIFNEDVVKRLIKIPIQCISKTTRVKALNSMCTKQKLSMEDFELVSCLLSNPTFKSSIETDVSVLEAILKQELYLFQVGNPIVEKVLANHISQLKDASSKLFITNLTSHLEVKMKSEFDVTTCKMAFLFSKAVGFEQEMSATVQAALTTRLCSFVEDSTKNSQSQPVVLWSLKVLYEIYECTEVSSLKKSIDSLTKNIAKKIPQDGLDDNMKAAIFSLFCTTNSNEPTFLLAHYLVLRTHLAKVHIYRAIEKVVETTSTDFEIFNVMLFSTVSSIKEAELDYSEGILELLELLFKNIEKGNEQGKMLFSVGLSEINTHLRNVVNSNKIAFLSLLDTLKSLLVWKPWLFSQHTIETLFPFCLRVNAVVMQANEMDNDAVFTCTSQLLSHILMYHRFKLTDRHHLVNSYMNSALEMLTVGSRYGLSPESAESFSRLLTVFCEPSNDAKNNKNKTSLQSHVGQVRKSLRRHASVLLLKYISLALGSSFDNRVKEALTSGFFSVFDVLSQAEYTAMIAFLDSPGRIYFKTLYAEYKRSGKWHEG
ncbi:LAFA_0G16534g1_1 [Lachancea sp. 'fantastica']|nr:LAFA_0G16534g1_1 [Lachancea sp. 'fantastica']